MTNSLIRNIIIGMNGIALLMNTIILGVDKSAPFTIIHCSIILLTLTVESDAKRN
jgi:hypothetical protein